MESFSKQINKIIKKTTKNTEKAVSGACLDITKEIIQRTPVDKGRLKGNWIPELNSRPNYSINTFDKTGSKTIAKAENKTNKIKIGDTYFLVNNLVYAPVVEYGLYPKPGREKTVDGYSTLAPQGMVRVTIEEVNDILKRAIKVNKS